ncbi:DUF397 domain-containing protein [Nocardiopsis algeriensis]|uniref:DUF397 domain-containing protein n=1 Tax=Nocardiopsis algeriensis TaxID=1478215 RepID=A0A841ISP4_9ACTN|nr:DUF397 domain-containing protein [Nocardiopsis algeriensis]MBB6121909.1 hypothetical protein [Nocardiopsis algeriensis]
MYSSESDLQFRKSSYSNPQNCVEVADLPGGDAAVRDSQNPELGHFTIPGAEWSALLGAVRR